MAKSSYTKTTAKTAAQLRKEEAEKKKKAAEAAAKAAANKTAAERRNELRESQGLQPSKTVSTPAATTKTNTTTPASGSTHGGGGGSFPEQTKTAEERRNELREAQGMAPSVNISEPVSKKKPVSNYTPKGAQADNIRQAARENDKMLVANAKAAGLTTAEQRNLLRQSKNLSPSTVYQPKGATAATKKYEVTGPAKKPALLKGLEYDETGKMTKASQNEYLARLHNAPAAGAGLEGDWSTMTDAEKRKALSGRTQTVDAYGNLRYDDIFIIHGRAVTVDDLIKQGYSIDLIRKLSDAVKGNSNDQLHRVANALDPERFVDAANAYLSNHPEAAVEALPAELEEYESRIRSGSFDSKEERNEYTNSYQRKYDQYMQALLASGGESAAFALSAAEKELADLKQVWDLIYANGNDKQVQRLGDMQKHINQLSHRVEDLRRVNNAIAAKAAVDKVQRNGDTALMKQLDNARSYVVNDKLVPLFDKDMTGSEYGQYDHIARADRLEKEAKSKGYTDEDIAAYSNYLREKDYDKLFGPYLKWLNEKTPAGNPAHPVAGPFAAGAVQAVTSPMRGIARLLTGAAGAEYDGTYADPGKLLTDVVKEGTDAAARNLEANIGGKGGKIVSKVYQYSLSAAESFVMGATMGPATSVVMGLNATADSYDEALNRGMSQTQAVALGITSGIFEALFEYISLDKIKVFNSTKLTGFKGRALMLLKSSGVEASEEVFTDVANEIADLFIGGELSNYNAAIARGMTPEEYAKQFGLQLVDSAVGGAFSGAAFGVASAVTQHGLSGISTPYNDFQTGKAIKQNGGVTEVVSSAKASENKRTQRLGTKLEEQLKGGKTARHLTGQVYNRLQNENIHDAAKQRAIDLAAEQGVQMTDRQAEAIATAAQETRQNARVTKDGKRVYTLSPGAEAAVKDGVGKQVIDELTSSRRVAEWAEQTRSKQRDFAVNTGAATDADAVVQRLNRNIDKKTPAVRKAIEEGKTYALIENGFEGRYGGEDGATVKLGGIVDVKDGKLELAVDYDAKSDVNPTAVFDATGNDGTVRSTDENVNRLLTALQDAINGTVQGETVETGGGTIFTGKKMTVEAANVALANFDPSVNTDVDAYVEGIYNAYKAGSSGMSLNGHMNMIRGNADGVTLAQLRQAWRTGAAAFDPKPGVTRIGDSQLTDVQLSTLSALDGELKKHNIAMVAVDHLDEDNGYYQRGSGVIVVALDADYDLSMTAAWHEAYHMIKTELGDTQGAEFVDATLELFKADRGDKALQKAIDQKKADYAKQGVTLTDAQVREEVAAQYFAALKTVDSMQMGEAFKGKRNLLETLRDALKGVMEAIRKGLLKLAVRDRSVYEALKSSADTMEQVLARVDAALEQTQQAREKEIADWGEVVKAEAWEGAESTVKTMQSLRIIPEKSEMQENIVTVANMNIVATMTGNEFAKGPIDLITQVSDYFDSIGNLVSNEYGDFVLDKDGAKDSLGHGMGRTKAIAYSAVPAVLQNGKLIDYQKNWKGRNYDTAVFSAPVEIAGEKYYEAVVVRVFPDSNKYYLHEVLIEKEGAEGLFKTGTQGKNPAPSNPTAPIFSLLQQIRNVNSNSSTPAAGSQEENGRKLTDQTAFSLRSTVEETRDLVAVHNMTTDQLKRSLDLGGLPMPSIAILKAQSGHARYGDVSLVFDKSTIDPQESSKNKVYGGDAWTPVYPTVEIKVNKSNQEKISSKYYELGRKYGYDAASPLYYYTNEAERALNNAKSEGALLKKLYEDTGLMQLYRLDKGLAQIETVQKVTRDTLSDAEVEQYDYIKNNFDLLDEVRELREKNAIRFLPWIKNHVEELEALNRKMYIELYGFSEEEAQNVIDQTQTRQYAEEIRGVLNYLKNGRETVRTEADTGATEDKIRAETDQADYRAWIDGMFKGIAEKSGIRNNRDYFDRNGNPRSWEALHYENNLENVVRVMSEEGIQKGGTGLFSGNSIWGVATKDYNSIAEIKKDSTRLGTMQEDDYSEIKKAFGDRFTEIANTIVDWRESNPFIAIDTAFENLIDAVRTNKTKAGMLRYLRQYSPQATEKTVDDMVALVKDISEMPTEYFEAKPMRAVVLDEIKNVILPDTAPAELTDALAEREIPFETYPAGDEDARKAALNRREDLLFSKRVTDARDRFEDETGGGAVSGMIDATLELLQKAHTELDKAQYDAWLQGEKTGGRMKARKGVMGVVKQYNDEKLTGVSNEQLTNQIMNALLDMRDYDFGADELLYTVLDVMATKAANQSEQVENETRDIIRGITKGGKYSIGDSAFNELVEMAGGRRRLNDVYRRVYGFTLVPDSEAEKRGAAISFDSAMQQVTDELPGLFSNSQNYFGFDTDNGSDVNMAAALYEMQDAMQMEERTQAEELGLDKLAPNSDEAMEATQTLYERAYADAASFAEDLIRLTPIRTLADAYSGKMSELRQAAKGQLQARQKEIAAIKERIVTAEAGLTAAAEANRQATAETARMERRIENLQGQLAVAERDATRARSAGDAKAAELEAKAEKLRRQIADLRDRLQKEKAKVKRRDAALVRAREDRDARLQAQREYYQDMRRRQAEKRRDTASRKQLREKLVRDVKWLRERLEATTDQKHIPEAMKKVVTPFVEAFLTNSQATGDHAVFTRDSIDRLLTFYERLNDQNAANEDNSAELATLYGLYDADVAEKLKNLKETLGGRRLSELTAAELQDMDDVIANLRHIVRDANSAFVNGKRIQFSESGQRFMQETREKKKDRNSLAQKIKTGADGININMAKPIYLFKEVVGGEIRQYFDAIREAQNVWAFRIRDSAEALAKIKEKYHFKDWNGKNSNVTFTLEDGTTAVLTKQAVMQIYATYKREMSLVTPSHHLTEGGIVLSEDLGDLQRKNAKKISRANVNAEMIDSKAHPLTEGDLRTLFDTLTDDQRGYVDECVAYLSGPVAGWGNEASMELHGYKKFGQGYYFPFQSSDLYLRQSIGVGDDARIKNKGFTKALTPGANNPIVITGFDEVLAKHIGDMASYSTLAVPLENLNRLLNFKIDRSNSVRADLNDTYGKAVNSYIREFLTQMNGGVKADRTEGFVNGMMGRFKRSAVALNASVMVQQPSAVARAMAMVNPQYFVRSTANFFDYKELMKYSGVAIVKQLGGWDTGTGRSTTDYLLGESSVSDRITEITGKGAEVMDAITWSHIWNAVKRETAHEMGITYHRKGMSDEFYRRAAERFNEVADYTQVYDSTLSRSQWMRSQSAYMKMATAFMAEPTTSYNMLVFSGQKKNGKTINKGAAIGAFVCNVVLNTALQSLVGAWRDKDDKSYWERWFKHLIEGVFGTRENLFTDSEFFIPNMIPFVKDFISLFQGYDVERSDMTPVSEIYKPLKKLIDKYNSRDDDQAIFDFLHDNSDLLLQFGTTLTNLTPLPMKSLYKDVLLGGKNAYEHAKAGDFHTTAQHISDIWKQNFEGEWDKNEQLYNAVLNHDQAALDRYLKVTDEDIQKYVNEANDELAAEAHAVSLKTKQLHTNIAQALVQMDTRIENAARAAYAGNIDEARRLIGAVTADGFDVNDVHHAIQLIGKELFPNDKEYTDKVTLYQLVTKDMVDLAYSDGNTQAVRTLRDAWIEQGTKADTVNDNIGDLIDEDYATGEITLADAKKAYADMTTFTEKKVIDRLTKQTAVLYENDGGMDYNTLRKVYADIGIAQQDLGKQMSGVIVSDYVAGKFNSKDEAVEAYMQQTGETDRDTAVMQFDYEDEKARDENFPLTFSNYKKYMESGLESTGITVKEYDQFLTATKDITSKSTSAGWSEYQAATAGVKSYNKYTCKQWHYVDAIDKTFTTTAQKDAAYKAVAAAENWSLAKLPLAPWR